jgi:hypothetical protein
LGKRYAVCGNCFQCIRIAIVDEKPIGFVNRNSGKSIDMPAANSAMDAQNALKELFAETIQEKP